MTQSDRRSSFPVMIRLFLILSATAAVLAASTRTRRQPPGHDHLTRLHPELFLEIVQRFHFQDAIRIRSVNRATKALIDSYLDEDLLDDLLTGFRIDPNLLEMIARFPPDLLAERLRRFSPQQVACLYDRIWRSSESNERKQAAFTIVKSLFGNTNQGVVFRSLRFADNNFKIGFRFRFLNPINNDPVRAEIVSILQGLDMTFDYLQVGGRFLLERYFRKEKRQKPDFNFFMTMLVEYGIRFSLHDFFVWGNPPNDDVLPLLNGWLECQQNDRLSPHLIAYQNEHPRGVLSPIFREPLVAEHVQQHLLEFYTIFFEKDFVLDLIGDGLLPLDAKIATTRFGNDTLLHRAIYEAHLKAAERILKIPGVNLAARTKRGVAFSRISPRFVPALFDRLPPATITALVRTDPARLVFCTVTGSDPIPNEYFETLGDNLTKARRARDAAQCWCLKPLRPFLFDLPVDAKAAGRDLFSVLQRSGRLDLLADENVICNLHRYDVQLPAVELLSSIDFNRDDLRRIWGVLADRPADFGYRLSDKPVEFVAKMSIAKRYNVIEHIKSEAAEHIEEHRSEFHHELFRRGVVLDSNSLYSLENVPDVLNLPEDPLSSDLVQFLSRAFQSGQIDVVEYVLEQVQEHVRRHKVEFYHTIASCGSLFELVKVQPIDAELVNQAYGPFDNTLLHTAFNCNNVALIAALLKVPGIEIAKRNRKGHVPFLYMMERIAAPLFKLLPVEHGLVLIETNPSVFRWVQHRLQHEIEPEKFQRLSALANDVRQ